MRQIAGVDGGGLAAALQVDAHADFGFVHHALRGFFAVAFGAAAVFGNKHVAQPHFQFAVVEGHAGITGGGEQAAEIGVGGGEGGFHQRRAGNGVGNLLGFFAAFGVVHADGDEFARALAVADDGLRQFEGEAAEQFFQLAVARVGDVVDFALAAFAGGDDNEAVVGAGIAVYRDAVERHIGDFLRQQLQNGLGDFGIGGDKAEHGGHVGMDHARAFGDAGGADGMVFADAAFARGGFGYGIGGHDGAGGVEPACGGDFGQDGDDAVGRQGFENDAGGEGQHLADGAADLFGCRFAHGQRAVDAVGARACVGVAGVDNEGAYAVGVEKVAFADTHGRGAEAILREHRADGAAARQHHQGEVVVMRLFDAGLAGEHADAVDGQQAVGGGRLVVDRHFVLLC